MALQGVASISYAGQRPCEGWRGRSSEKEGCGRVLESKDNRRRSRPATGNGKPKRRRALHRDGKEWMAALCEAKQWQGSAEKAPQSRGKAEIDLALKIKFKKYKEKEFIK